MRRTTCAGALVGALLLGVTGLAGQADQPRITDLRFTGNQSFSDGALANAIVTRQTECRNVLLAFFCWAGSDWAFRPAFLSARTLARDVARIRIFYYQRGFREASVDTTLTRPSPDEVEIAFRIREGRPVRVDSLSVTGVEGTVASEVAREVLGPLPLEVGDPLSGILMESSRDSLRSRLQNRGHAHADVLRNYSIPADDPYSARVSFEVFPGPLTRLGPLTVVGNQAVSDAVVRRMLPFQEGDLFEQERIYNAQRNLYNLDIFRHAEIQADLEHRPDSVVPLRIQVNEGDVHRVRTGAGWNNADCFNTESSWASRNFRGGARRLQVTGRLSNILAPTLHQTVCNESGAGEFGELNWHLSTDFTQPWLLSPLLSFSAGVFGERQSLKDVFVREAVGLSVSLTRTLDASTGLTLAYRPELSRLDAAEIFFCTSFLVCDPADIGVVQSANWLAPIVLSFSRDRSNQVLNPSRGYTVRAELEHASDLTGSNFAYNRAVGEVDLYTEPAEGLVAAFRVRGGWITPEPFGQLLGRVEDVEIVHPQKRFFAGGSNSVRGFAQNQLGPRVLSVPVHRLLEEGVCEPRAVADLTCDASALDSDLFTPRPTGGSSLLEANVELRFPVVGDRTQGALFLDVGQVWPEVERVSLDELRFTPGLGMRYMTPIGPVRLDVAYQLDAGERLRVVTTQVRPYDPAVDSEDDWLPGPDDTRLPWVRADQLALLQPPVLFGDAGTWDLERFQIHLSIGQAF